MKERIAAVLLVLFLVIFTCAMRQQSKINFKRSWINMTVNFNRKRIIEREAKLNKLDPDWLRAIIFIESRGDSSAISETGCRGITQINRGNAKYFGYEHEEMHDDEKALIVAARLNKESRDYYKTNPKLQKQESEQTWLAREYSKGRGKALNNFLVGLDYARNLIKVYQAIKAGAQLVSLNGRIEKIDLDKINGEA